MQSRDTANCMQQIRHKRKTQIINSLGKSERKRNKMKCMQLERAMSRTNVNALHLKLSAFSYFCLCEHKY